MWGALAGAAPLWAGCASAPAVPPPLKDRAILGIGHPLASLAARERSLAYTFAIVGGVYYTFDTTWARHTRELAPAAGRQLMVSWMPQTATGKLKLADIPAGKYDAHIDQMLRGMRAFEGPVICRWGHEPNGNWYPWSVACTTAGCSTPGQYVNAWRYIVGRERRMAGRSNIRWFWCANGTDIPSAATGKRYTLEQYWPGDAWVDLVGCDAYNEPATWDTFDGIFKRPYARISKLSGKPFWIGEVGCHEPRRGQRGTKGAWIQAMLDSTAFPNLRAVCYFDFDARVRKRADWRFDSSPGTFASVKKSLKTVPKRV